MFYLASAVLLDRNLRFKKHSAVHTAFGREFAYHEIVPEKGKKWKKGKRGRFPLFRLEKGSVPF
jgi:uncharacterized protein (UPF0332 family)